MSKQQMMLSALIAVGLLTTGCKTSGTASIDGGVKPLLILRHMEASDHAFRHAAVEVLRSQADLEHHGSGTLASMVIDFNEQSAVVLALGEQPTAGWSAQITSVQHHHDRLYVQGIAHQPADDEVVASVLTYPIAVAIIPRVGEVVVHPEIIDIVGNDDGPAAP